MSKQIYDHNHIEEKWMKAWEEQGLFQGSEAQPGKGKKKYILFAFAYPSGSGLHVGHVESKTALDILSRFYRMQGEEVFFPVGWDAFGLPAENYAVKTGVHPSITTKNAIDTFRRQIKRVGVSYDWKNEIATNHPEYYKWTQWIFLQLHHKKLAYQKNGMVNWCPSCQTVLANEQVVNGQCERCGSDVIQKEMKQWYFNITKYQDELISGLDQVDWPNATKQQQLNWIGKSRGLRIDFVLSNRHADSDLHQNDDSQAMAGQAASASKQPGHPELVSGSIQLPIWTKFWETVYGTTFVVIAPEKFNELNLSEKVSEKHKEAVARYIDLAFKKTEEERKIGEKDKTGVDTGLKVVNPVNGKEVPLFIADYVLMNVGTGIVMGVPAHDQRDFEFAQKFDLEILPVVQKKVDVYRSYLIGSDNITDEELQAVGAKLVGKSSQGTRRIEIPNTHIEKYQELIREKLSPGFWNEIIGEKVWFMFKDKAGKNTEYYLNQANVLEIAQKCSEYNNELIEKTSNLWLYLSQDDWYREYIIHEDAGTIINSDKFNGWSNRGEDKEKMAEEMIKSGAAEWKTTYKLRDWLISRQRYWGAPIPVVYDPEGNAHPVKEDHLPWTLPTDVEFKPTGESPLTYSKEFMERTERLYGKGWRPEYDTMDTFVDSSWYFLRYIDSRNSEVFASPEQLKKWLPVDLYMIGPEHIVLHLLYSRFFTKFLRDEGYLHFDEPFMKMRHQGMILGPDGKKMSKSKGNVINPDDVIEKYGADTLRVYEMFMGPIEADKPWNTNSVVGVYRFLNRVWNAVANVSLSAKAEDANIAVRRKLHQTIKKVSEDIPNLKFNTAIASMMELMNVWEEEEKKSDGKSILPIDDVVAFIKVLCPFAPFMAEELFQMVSSSTAATIHTQPWPQFDSSLIQEEEVKIVIQVNGKLRSEIMVPQEDVEDKDKVIAFAKADEKANTWILGKEVVKEIYVPRKLVNIVIKM